jgi:hypothetical protein|tara:strand:+ start:1207 stop:1383 length:177 start_codon:yes stop_codon:yes gene_type:complete
MTDKLTEIKNIEAWHDEEHETIRVVINMEDGSYYYADMLAYASYLLMDHGFDFVPEGC